MKRQYQRGFTAMEIVVVTALSMLLMTALLRFLVAGYPLSKITLLQANSNETARNQLRRIARELREVKYADTGAYPLVTMDSQEVIFYANVDSDSNVERVRYTLAGTELHRGVINASGNPLAYDPNTEVVTVVSKSIQNGADPVFTYYSGDYPDDQTPLTPADVTEVKYIQFLLLIDADSAVDPPPIEVRSQVQLRNVKTNLGETTGA